MYCRIEFLSFFSDDIPSTMYMMSSSAVRHTVDISCPSVGAVYSAATIRTSHVRYAAY